MKQNLIYWFIWFTLLSRVLIRAEECPKPIALIHGQIIKDGAIAWQSE